MRPERLLDYFEANEGKIAHAAWAFYSAHHHMRHKTVDELSHLVKMKSKQAAWYFIIASVGLKKSRSLGFESTVPFYKASIELMNNQAAIESWLPFKLSSTGELAKRLIPFHKALKSKRKDYSKAFESIMSKRIGNTNATRMGIEQQASMISIYKKVKYKKTTYKVYMERAEQMIKAGFWKEEESRLCESSVIAFLSKPSTKAIIENMY